MTKPKIDTRTLVAKLSQEGATLLQREIVAPVLPGGKIRTRLNGLVYEFKPRGKFSGWGLFRPINQSEAQFQAEALPWQRAAYLELFPLLRVILLWPIGANEVETIQTRSQTTNNYQKANVWWALPFNSSDAQHRFGLAGDEPLRVWLCDPLNGAERFERVITRLDGKTLWFEGPDALADPTQAEWLRDTVANFAQTQTEAEIPKPLAGLSGSQRLALLYGQIHQLEVTEMVEIQRLAEAEIHNQASVESTQLENENLEVGPVHTTQVETANNESGANQRATNRQQPNLPGSRHPNGRLYRRMLRQQRERQMEQRLRYALEKADATLYSYSETTNADGSPGHLLVEWSEHGHTYRYRTLIGQQDNNFTVVSSGICLSGRDSDFDLTSLVNVMRRDDY
jgi:hypothetical protein